MQAQLLTVATGRLGAPLDELGGTWDWVAGGMPEMVVECAAQPWLDGALPLPLLGRDGLALILDDGEPWIAGPIIGPIDDSKMITTKTVGLTARGIEHVFDGWIVLPANYRQGADLMAAPPLTIRANSWGTIAARLVQSQVARNGRLPIVYGSLIEDGNRYVRNYDTWNLANNGLWKRLTELQALNEDGDVPGPDMSFRPEMAGAVDLRWRMLWGTSRQSSLPQDWVPVIDLTSAQGPVAGWSPIVAWEPATRVYAVGAGQESGQLVSMSDRRELLGLGMIPREHVMPDTSNDDWPLLQRRADSRAAHLSRPVVQLTVTLDARHQATRLGGWMPGHIALVTVPEGASLHIPAGTRRWRCIRMHGRIGASTYTVELQEV